MITAVLVAITYQPIQAQEYIFKVLASKGTNQIRSADQTEWGLVKTGASLKLGDLLKLYDDAYLGLVHFSGQTTELSSPGIFKIEDLSSRMGKNKKGIASKYAEFVLNQLERPNRDDRLQSTGAVTRALGDVLTIFLPPQSEVLNRQQILTWSSGPDNATYILQIMNLFSDVLYQVEITETHFHIDFNLPELRGQNVFVIKVSVKEKNRATSNVRVIGLLTAKESEIHLSGLDSLNQEIDIDTALGQIITAAYFEDNGLLVDAGTAYQKAMTLAPGVEDFQQMYREFILRNKLGQ